MNPQIEFHIIFFSDIHHCSHIFAALNEKFFDFIQDVFEMMGDIIVENKGEILKYEGDSLLAILPENKEKEIITGAIEMRKMYQIILNKYEIKTESEIEIGIGSGKIMVGTIGHKSLKMKEIYGFPVFDVGKLTHHRGIAITQGVYDKVKDHFQTRRLPDMEVRWREEGVACWEIVE
jgi:class 3 adenylate cyclase